MNQKTKIFMLSAMTLMLATSCGPSKVDTTKAKETAKDIVIQIDGNKVNSPDYVTIDSKSNVSNSINVEAKEVYNGVDLKFYIESSTTIEKEGVTIKTQAKHWVYKLDGFIYHSEFTSSVAGTVKQTTKNAYESDTDAIELFQETILVANAYCESLKVLDLTKNAANGIIEFIDDETSVEGKDELKFDFYSSGKGSLVAEATLTKYEGDTLKGTAYTKSEIKDYLIKSQETEIKSVDGNENIVGSKYFDYGKNKIELPSLEEYPIK